MDTPWRICLSLSTQRDMAEVVAVVGTGSGYGRGGLHWLMCLATRVPVDR
ncbi:MAG TPA: hypothetical protein VE860_05340 [Chthoniobacterales bacterium]|nr:hypothetical protein [Chthoniobacterales bacterium]